MTLSRVTQSIITNSTLQGLQSSLASVQTLQTQLSSGKRVSVPSDDPAATSQAMLLSSQKAAADQYARNITSATGSLGVADSTLQDLSNQLQSVRNLLVQSGDGALTSDGRSALATQITSIRSSVVDLYNTQYLDRPIFGGTIQGSNALDPTTAAYLGNDQPIATRVSQATVVRTDVKGSDVGADTVPGLLTSLATAVTAPGGAAGSDLTSIDAELSKVSQALGDVGARETQVNQASTRVQTQQANLTDQISQNLDVDLPATIMNLQMQQVAYQSALGAASKVMQKSLVDYLA